MRNILLIGLLVCAGIVGCQAIQDTRTGISTPRQTGETGSLPQDYATQASGLVGTVFPPAATPVGFLALVIAGWIRGRKLRKNLPLSTTPATGFIGSATGLEAVIQQLANVAHGIFEIGTEGTALKTGWQVAAVGALTAVGIPWLFQIPVVHNFASHNVATLVGVIGLFAAVIASTQEQLSKVLPVAPAPSPTPAP